MARSPILLDSSALLTLIEDEAGAQRVEQVLREEETILPWMALLEIHYVTRQEKGEDEADRRFALLQQLGCKIVWEVDERLVLTASALKVDHRVSLADSIIAAYASRAGAVLLHKDPEFEALADRVHLEALPYKVVAKKDG